jgi:alkylation response protein AidB-like acyl-CoA dehydrogenase
MSMDLALTDEQLALQSSYADFFGRESGVDIVRAAEPLGFSVELWKRLADTGLGTMGLPESVDGGGAGSLELVLVAQEYGRRIAPVPVVEVLAAADTLARCGAGKLAADLAAESAVVTLALVPAQHGTLRLVPAGAVADVVVCLDGDDLVAMRRSRHDHAAPVHEPNFGSSPLADWRVQGAERSVLASGNAARRLHRQGCDLWKLLTSAALNGLQQSALEIAVTYVKTREAFGRPIGWFQAVQHRLADVAVAGDGARLLTYEAAWARDTGQEKAAALATMAFLFSSETALHTARESLQFHGGYGYTLEYDIQLFFRRAKAWPMSLGDPRRHYQDLALRLYG